MDTGKWTWVFWKSHLLLSHLSSPALNLLFYIINSNHFFHPYFFYILKILFSLSFRFYWWRRWWMCVSGMGKHVWKREVNFQELLSFFHCEFSGSNLGHQVCSGSVLNCWGIFWPCLFLRQCATMSPLLAWNLGSTWVSLMIVGIMSVYLALVVLLFRVGIFGSTFIYHIHV